MAKKMNIAKTSNAYNINAVNKMAMARGLKPLTNQEFNSMSKQQVAAYIKHLKQVQAINRKDARAASKTLRRNAKLVASENYKQSQLTHGTIRQGITELGILGSQGLAQVGLPAYSNPKPSKDGVSQNVSGGTTDVGGSTEQGPVYAYQGRSEE